MSCKHKKASTVSSDIQEALEDLNDVLVHVADAFEHRLRNFSDPEHEWVLKARKSLEEGRGYLQCGEILLREKDDG